MSTKQAIIAAAKVLFAEKGYEGMTIKEIANMVGVTPPAVYAFFKNKEDVFEQIFKEILQGQIDLVMYYVNQYESDSVEVKLDQYFRKVMEHHLNDALHMKIYMRLLLFPPDVFNKDLKADLLQTEIAEHELFCRLFEKGIQSGELKEGDSHSYATVLINMLDGLFWAMQRYDEETFWGKFETIRRHFWQSIKE